MGGVREGSQSLRARCFDWLGAAADQRWRARLGLRDADSFAAADGDSRDRRRETASGGFLVAGFIEAGYLPIGFQECRALHLCAIRAAESTATESVRCGVSIAGRGVADGRADYF